MPTWPVGSCDRRTGIGADGLISGTRGGTAGADLTMVLLNADGSRAEMSGNGIRCLAQAWVARAARTPERTCRSPPTPGCARSTVVSTTDPATVRPTSTWARRSRDPTSAELVLDAGAGVTVDVGNPHLVLLVDDVVPVDLDADGPFIELGIEGGINVESIAPDPGAAAPLDLRVWERGAGHHRWPAAPAPARRPTRAHAWGLVGERVTVAMPGGEVEVRLGDTITLIGPATHVADRSTIQTRADATDRWSDGAHRSAFGEYGGESSGFIERTFRERIVLVGVTLPPVDRGGHRGRPRRARGRSSTPPAPTWSTASCSGGRRPDPATYIGKGKAERAARTLPRQSTATRSCSTTS